MIDLLLGFGWFYASLLWDGPDCILICLVLVGSTSSSGFGCFDFDFAVLWFYIDDY